MVSILPAERSPWQVIDKAIGRNIEQNMPQAVQQGFNRGQLQQSLQKMKGLSSQNLSPLELITSMMEAGAGIPGSEKYMAQLYPMLLKQTQGQMMPGGPQGAGMNAPSSGSQQQATPSTTNPEFKQKNEFPIPLPEPSFEPYKENLEGIELGAGPIPKTYTPEQYQQVNQQYMQSGLDPTPAINSMQIQDEAARNRLKDIISGAETTGKLADLRAQQQARVSEKLRSHLPELNEADFAIAERISNRPEFKDIKNDNLRAQKVKQEFDLYQSAVNNFNKNSERFNYNQPEYERQISQLGNYAQTMVKNGQRDVAEQILKNNGWGPVETQRILNPLSQDVVKSFKNAPRVVPPDEMIKVLPDDPRFDSEANKAIKRHESQVKEYGKVIQENFKTGSYDPSSNVVPGTSLLQMRDEALQKGVSWQEFEGLINDLISKGKIKLDSYQENERGLLGQHPDKSFSIGEIIWRLNPFYKERK